MGQFETRKIGESNWIVVSDKGEEKHRTDKEADAVAHEIALNLFYSPRNKKPTVEILRFAKELFWQAGRGCDYYPVMYINDELAKAEAAASDPFRR